MLLGNRALLGKNFSGDPVVAFRQLEGRSDAEKGRVLLSHGISEAAWRALTVNDERRFAELRRAHLIEVEIEFMKRQGVAPPRTATATGYNEMPPDPIEDWDV